MSIIKKIILCIKNIFTKQNKVKKLVEPRILVNEDKKENFIKALKVTTTQKIAKKNIETLTCAGDGLGIQKKITC